MKTIPYKKFKHGMKVTCTIDGTKIEDAKISINDSGEVFICQNEELGSEADRLLGYKYSWSFIDSPSHDYKEGVYDVKDLILPSRTLDDLEEGDVIVEDDGDETMILGVCGKVYFISLANDFNKADGSGWTLDELKADGYTLKQEEEEIVEMTELTLDEVAKQLNIPVKNLRIKD